MNQIRFRLAPSSALPHPLAVFKGPTFFLLIIVMLLLLTNKVEYMARKWRKREGERKRGKKKGNRGEGNREDEGRHPIFLPGLTPDPLQGFRPWTPPMPRPSGYRPLNENSLSLIVK